MDNELEPSPRSWLDDFMQWFSWCRPFAQASPFLNNYFLLGVPFGFFPSKNIDFSLLGFEPNLGLDYYLIFFNFSALILFNFRWYRIATEPYRQLAIIACTMTRAKMAMMMYFIALFCKKWDVFHGFPFLNVMFHTCAFESASDFGLKSALFRNKRFMLDEMTWQNALKFAIF